MIAARQDHDGFIAHAVRLNPVTPEEQARLQVVEERLARLATAVLLLLEAIDNGTADQVAREVWEFLQDDNASEEDQ